MGEKYKFENPRTLADRRRAALERWKCFKTLVAVLIVLGLSVWPFVPFYFALRNSSGLFTNYSHPELMQWISISAVALVFFTRKFWKDPSQPIGRKKFLNFFTYIYLTAYYILLKTYFALNALEGEGE